MWGPWVLNPCPQGSSEPVSSDSPPSDLLIVARTRSSTLAKDSSPGIWLAKLWESWLIPSFYLNKAEEQEVVNATGLGLYFLCCLFLLPDSDLMVTCLLTLNSVCLPSDLWVSRPGLFPGSQFPLRPLGQTPMSWSWHLTILFWVPWSVVLEGIPKEVILGNKWSTLRFLSRRVLTASLCTQLGYLQQAKHRAFVFPIFSDPASIWSGICRDWAQIWASQLKPIPDKIYRRHPQEMLVTYLCHYFVGFVLFVPVLSGGLLDSPLVPRWPLSVVATWWGLYLCPFSEVKSASEITHAFVTRRIDYATFGLYLGMCFQTSQKLQLAWDAQPCFFSDVTKMT